MFTLDVLASDSIILPVIGSPFGFPVVDIPGYFCDKFDWKLHKVTCNGIVVFEAADAFKCDHRFGNIRVALDSGSVKIGDQVYLEIDGFDLHFRTVR